MTGTSFSHLRPRANISQPVRGRACGSMGAPVRNPRRLPVRRPRCTMHARRRPAAKIRPRKAAARVPAAARQGGNPTRRKIYRVHPGALKAAG